ncbi:uncharacterized protein isoform X2 [Musca autumnalis]
MPKIPIYTQKYPWISTTSPPKTIPESNVMSSKNRKTNPISHQVAQTFHKDEVLQRVKTKLKAYHTKHNATTANKEVARKLREIRRNVERIYQRSNQTKVMDSKEETEPDDNENSEAKKSHDDAVDKYSDIENTLKDMGLENSEDEDDEWNDMEIGVITETVEEKESTKREENAKEDENQTEEVIDLNSSVEEVETQQQNCDAIDSLGSVEKEKNDTISKETQQQNYEPIDLSSSVEEEENNYNTKDIQQHPDEKVINLDESVEIVHVADFIDLTELENNRSLKQRNIHENSNTKDHSPIASHLTDEVCNYIESLNETREFHQILSTCNAAYPASVHDEAITNDLHSIQNSIYDFATFLQETYKHIDDMECERRKVCEKYVLPGPNPSELVVKIEAPEMPKQIITYRTEDILQCSLENLEAGTTEEMTRANSIPTHETSREPEVATSHHNTTQSSQIETTSNSHAVQSITHTTTVPIYTPVSRTSVINHTAQCQRETNDDRNKEATAPETQTPVTSNANEGASIQMTAQPSEDANPVSERDNSQVLIEQTQMKTNSLLSPRCTSQNYPPIKNNNENPSKYSTNLNAPYRGQELRSMPVLCRDTRSKSNVFEHPRGSEELGRHDGHQIHQDHVATNCYRDISRQELQTSSGHNWEPYRSHEMFEKATSPQTPNSRQLIPNVSNESQNQMDSRWVERPRLATNVYNDSLLRQVPYPLKPIACHPDANTATKDYPITQAHHSNVPPIAYQSPDYSANSSTCSESSILSSEKDNLMALKKSKKAKKRKHLPNELPHTSKKKKKEDGPQDLSQKALTDSNHAATKTSLIYKFTKDKNSNETQCTPLPKESTSKGQHQSKQPANLTNNLCQRTEQRLPPPVPQESQSLSSLTHQTKPNPPHPVPSIPREEETVSHCPTQSTTWKSAEYFPAPNVHIPPHFVPPYNEHLKEIHNSASTNSFHSHRREEFLNKFYPNPPAPPPPPAYATTMSHIQLNSTVGPGSFNPYPLPYHHHLQHNIPASAPPPPQYHPNHNTPMNPQQRNPEFPVNQMQTQHFFPPQPHNDYSMRAPPRPNFLGIQRQSQEPLRYHSPSTQVPPYPVPQLQNHQTASPLQPPLGDPSRYHSPSTQQSPLPPQIFQHRLPSPSQPNPTFLNAHPSLLTPPQSTERLISPLLPPAPYNLSYCGGPNSTAMTVPMTPPSESDISHNNPVMSLSSSSSISTYNNPFLDTYPHHATTTLPHQPWTNNFNTSQMYQEQN